ncbi:MAG TPA: alanine--tRNA ligase [Candidatus Binatia bacterium]|nr:alanine--tRNA ligase [Candidatus Binatia bacterium]
MLTDKEAKVQLKALAAKTPDKYYATGVLKEEGFARRQCTKCHRWFWTTTHSTVCGDPSCSGGFRFIGKSPAKFQLDYIETWQKFAKLFSKWGYTPIKRYPVVARWRQDTDFVQASIYDFQPYVVTGEVAPPANPLVVPQFCLRFNDIDNVGITGAHYTGFVMIGQHAFMPPEKYDQPKYFRDIHNWLKQGLGLKNDDITFHEDAWAGGGNSGPSMEYFSGGLELGNQVYMSFQNTNDGFKPLPLKVLDMGMGHERNAWFSQGRSTSYETTFPEVIKHLRNGTGVQVDEDLMGRFLPYASYLNVDEVEDLNKAWTRVADEIGEDKDELKKTVSEQAALYSVAEHTRSLLFALADGALPSNVGGMYNLRVILRRALQFIDKYQWNVHLANVAEWHADYLKPLFPELHEHLAEVHKILDVEKAKYDSTKQKTAQMLARVLDKELTTDQLVELYDTQGINPDMIAEEAAKKGKKITVPDNFYAIVAEKHDKKEQEHATVREEKLDLSGVADTQARYYEDWRKVEFSAQVMKVMGNFVILNETHFYPTSGGQLHDVGTLNSHKVVDVFKQGGVIVHVLDTPAAFKPGEKVTGKIDFNRRQQLAQHHTATHIINAAARRVLGNHINQASAKKDIDKAHIDITHYQLLTQEEMDKIEKEANRIVQEAIPSQLKFVPRTEAEQKYGMGIYQGGAVPGKVLRIVEIPEIDVEACGGTHLHNTSEAGKIKLLKASKVQDGVVRITFVAGKAAEQIEHAQHQKVDELAKFLGCLKTQIAPRVQEIFDKWKKARKAFSSQKPMEPDWFRFVSSETFNGDQIAKAAEILQTQPENIVKTIQRFLNDLMQWKKK